MTRYTGTASANTVMDPINCEQGWDFLLDSNAETTQPISDSVAGNPIDSNNGQTGDDEQPQFVGPFCPDSFIFLSQSI